MANFVFAFCALTLRMPLLYRQRLNPQLRIKRCEESQENRSILGLKQPSLARRKFS